MNGTLDDPYGHIKYCKICDTALDKEPITNEWICKNCEQEDNKIEPGQTEQTFECRDCKHKFVSNVPFNYYVCEKCGGSAFPIDLDCERDICPNCYGAGECAGDYFSEDGMTTCNRCNGTGIL
jgi:hypothetical protein